jgi:hypothetical protein
LADLTYVKGHMSATYNTLGGTLTVSNGTQRVLLKLSGNYTNATWVLSKDSTGGTTVVDPPANTSPPTSTLDSLLGGDLPPSSSFGLTAQATTGMQTPASPPPDILPGLAQVVALFYQFIASGFSGQHGGVPITNALSQIVANEEQFLAKPHG